MQAAFLIARLDNAEVDVDAYRAEVDRMAEEDQGVAAQGRQRSSQAQGVEQVLVHGARLSRQPRRLLRSRQQPHCRKFSTTARGCRSRFPCCIWSWADDSD